MFGAMLKDPLQLAWSSYQTSLLLVYLHPPNNTLQPHRLPFFLSLTHPSRRAHKHQLKPGGLVSKPDRSVSAEETCDCGHFYFLFFRRPSLFIFGSLARVRNPKTATGLSARACIMHEMKRNLFSLFYHLQHINNGSLAPLFS